MGKKLWSPLSLISVSVRLRLLKKAINITQIAYVANNQKLANRHLRLQCKAEKHLSERYSFIQ